MYNSAAQVAKDFGETATKMVDDIRAKWGGARSAMMFDGQELPRKPAAFLVQGAPDAKDNGIWEMWSDGERVWKVRPRGSARTFGGWRRHFFGDAQSVLLPSLP